MFKQIITALLVAGTVGSTFVFANTPVINRREKRQMHRINQGEKKGQLTADQAAQLKDNVKDVRQEKNDMIKANGGKPLTASQRKVLRQELNKNSKEIYQERHEGTTASPAAQQ